MILATASAIFDQTTLPAGWRADPAAQPTTGGLLLPATKGDWNPVWAQSPDTAALGDVQVVVEWEWASGVNSMPLQICSRRTPGADLYPSDEYRVELRPFEFAFSQRAAGQETAGTSTTGVEWSPGRRWKARFRAQGAHLSVRVWAADKPEPTTWLAEWDAPTAITSTGGVAVTQKATGSDADTGNVATVYSVLTYDLAGDSDATPGALYAPLEYAGTIDVPAVRLAGGLTLEAHDGPASTATAVRPKGSLLITDDGLATSNGVGAWTVASPSSSSGTGGTSTPIDTARFTITN